MSGIEAPALTIMQPGEGKETFLGTIGVVSERGPRLQPFEQEHAASGFGVYQSQRRRPRANDAGPRARVASPRPRSSL